MVWLSIFTNVLLRDVALIVSMDVRREGRNECQASFLVPYSDVRASSTGMYPLSLPSMPLTLFVKSRATKQASKLRVHSTVLSRRSSCKKGR